MVSTYDLSTFRDAVRALVPNIGKGQITDSQLDVLLRNAKRQVDAVKPRVRTAVVAGTPGKYYQATDTIPGWADNFSAVRSVLNPAPDVSAPSTATTDPAWVNLSDVRVLRINELEYIYMRDPIGSGHNAAFTYTVPWDIQDLDGAETTTIDTTVQSGLEFCGAEFLCRALAAKAAGTLDTQIPADLINYGSKQAEYTAAADAFHVNYTRALGIDATKPKGIIMRGDYNHTLQSGFPYVTHFSQFR